MSSYIDTQTNPKTGKKQKCFALDDFYGRHEYGYGFPKDGSDADFKDIGEGIVDKCDFYPWEVIKNKDKEQTLFESFILYHHTYPEQRFWQALRNWSKYNFIYGSDVSLEEGLDKLIGLKDTFYD